MFKLLLMTALIPMFDVSDHTDVPDPLAVKQTENTTVSEILDHEEIEHTNLKDSIVKLERLEQEQAQQERIEKERMEKENQTDEIFVETVVDQTNIPVDVPKDEMDSIYIDSNGEIQEETTGDVLYSQRTETELQGTETPVENISTHVNVPVTSNNGYLRAQQYLGIPYVYGGRSLSGLDCSGLVYMVYGSSVGTYTGTQQYAGPRIPVNEAKAGDLLFWGTGTPYHVAISDGQGGFIHAPVPGQNVSHSPIYSHWYPSFAVDMSAWQ